MSRAHGMSRVPAPRAAARPPRALHREGRDRARPARARRNCCASPTRTWPPWRHRRWPAQILAAGRGASRATACGPSSTRRTAGPAAGTTPLYPAGLARRRRRPLGADRSRRPGPARSAWSPSGAVTVVGARRASTYGREVARELGRELAAAGLIVVSGLAFGIDACAHRGALEAGLDGRGARLRRRRRLSGRASLALAPDRRVGAWSSPSCRPAPAPGAGPSRRATGSWRRSRG